MIYELFLGWRYVYARRRSLWLRLIISLSLVLGLVGATISVATLWKMSGAIIMVFSALLFGLGLLLMLLRPFTAIAVMGVGIGVAILIAVLAITSGFQKIFREKVLGVNAHLLVLKYGTDFSEYEEIITKVTRDSAVKAAAPFAFHQMMLARGNRLSGVLVKGVDPERAGKVLDLENHLLPDPAGSLPQSQAGQTAPEKTPVPRQSKKLMRLLNRSRDPYPSKKKGRRPDHISGLPEIIIGKSLAQKLALTIGERVRLISPLSPGPTPKTANDIPLSSTAAATQLPRSRSFRVSAIFDSGFAEYDKRLVYVNLRETQSFFEQGDVVMGVEMRLHDLLQAEETSKRLERELGGIPYRLVPWADLNRNLFRALEDQKNVLKVVIGFIIVVAAFNVLSALAILVLRKTREIALLKSLGLSAFGAGRVFQSVGLVVWLFGTGLGLLWGYLGCKLLQYYRFPLDAGVYMISSLPVEIRPTEYVLASAFTLAVCLLATIYPALRAALQTPVDGLRV